MSTIFIIIIHNLMAKDRTALCVQYTTQISNSFEI